MPNDLFSLFAQIAISGHRFWEAILGIGIGIGLLGLGFNIVDLMILEDDRFSKKLLIDPIEAADDLPQYMLGVTLNTLSRVILYPIRLFWAGLDTLIRILFGLAIGINVAFVFVVVIIANQSQAPADVQIVAVYIAALFAIGYCLIWGIANGIIAATTMAPVATRAALKDFAARVQAYHGSRMRVIVAIGLCVCAAGYSIGLVLWGVVIILKISGFESVGGIDTLSTIFLVVAAITTGVLIPYRHQIKTPPKAIAQL